VVRVVDRQDAVEAVQEDRIVRGLFETLLVDALQEGLRVVADGVPEAGVQPGEQRARRAIPAVPSFQRKLESSPAVAGAMSAAGPQRSLG
jgi:hypothetical protein